jgi:hypothetical protein
METDHALIMGNDVTEILKAHVPDLKIEQVNETNLFKLIDGFAAYTIELLKKGNLSAIKHCFNTAEIMLLEGSAEVKLAIENVYVFSVTTFFEMGHAVSKQIKELLPLHLMEEYHKQVSTSHP